MGLVFKGLHPVFPRNASEAKAREGVERSPYYWWFEYLKRNELYRECCLNGGSGPLADFYADWGVVLNDTPFKAWWYEHGYTLFAEERSPIKLQELANPSQWDPAWTAAEVMVVAVPLSLGKRYIQGFLARLLKTRHKGKRGRQKEAARVKSSASYKLKPGTIVKTLRLQLEIYDAVMAVRRGEDNRTLAKIGADLKLVKKAMPSPREFGYIAAKKRAVMAATVSRHFRQARQNIEGATQREFPVVKSNIRDQKKNGLRLENKLNQE
jgi:hypothetical protein